MVGLGAGKSKAVFELSQEQHSNYNLGLGHTTHGPHWIYDQPIQEAGKP